MNQSCQLFFRRLCWSLSLTVWLGVARQGGAEDKLVWNKERNLVEAQIESWDLPKLLAHIAAATGWEIFLEPGTEHKVEAKFKNHTTAEALRHLLGNLNYALLPKTNAAPKLFVFQYSLADATQLIKPPEPAKSKTEDPIPNELIVSLKPGAGESIDDFAKRLGAKIVGRSDGLKAYRLQFEDEAATKSAREQLANQPDISAVDFNYNVEHPGQLESLTMSSGPSFNLKPRLSSDGSRVVVGLIDTPVQSQAAGLDKFLLPALSVAGEGSAPGDRPTHGTSMTETILHGLALAQQDGAGVNVRILPVDVYGRNPSTTTFDVANGVYTAINNGATVINLSLGGDGESPFLHRLIQQGHEQGVMFIAAAGNDASTALTYPAAYPEVLAVTSGDKRGNLAPYANRGNFVDVVAPGTSIINFGNQSYLVSGTSASTAYISGLAAGIAASSGKPLREVETKIREAMALGVAAKSPRKP